MQTIKNDSINNDKGFSIIEILIAILVFAIAGTAIMQMQLNSMKGTSSALGTTEASIVLSSEIERLLSLDYANADLVDLVGVLPDGKGGTTYTNSQTGATLTFSNAYTVTNIPLPGSTTETYKQISVTTTWTKGKKILNITGQTIKLNNG